MENHKVNNSHETTSCSECHSCLENITPLLLNLVMISEVKIKEKPPPFHPSVVCFSRFSRSTSLSICRFNSHLLVNGNKLILDKMMGVEAMGEIGDMLTMCNRLRVDTNYTRDVVVTGFDTPFEDYDENPSAAVVDELMKEKIENVKIHPHKIPATYEGVVETLPSLRENFPDEVLHLAAHSIKNTIYFEDRAFSDGYCFEDSKGFIPKKIDIENEDEKTKKPFVDFDYLIEEITENCGLDGEKYGGLKLEKSKDPGRFVGGYLYYLSLCERAVNTLFMHVPPFEGECSKEAVTNVIREAIRVITRNDF